MANLPQMPHSSEFNQHLLVLGDEVELEKLRKALTIDHPLIKAFKSTSKNIPGDEGKEEKFFSYLQQLEAYESSGEEQVDGARPSFPSRPTESERFDLSTPLRSRAVIPDASNWKEKTTSESTRGRYCPPSPTS
jgi:hypothetical protein